MKSVMSKDNKYNNINDDLSVTASSIIGYINKDLEKVLNAYNSKLDKYFNQKHFHKKVLIQLMLNQFDFVVNMLKQNIKDKDEIKKAAKLLINIKSKFEAQINKEKLNHNYIKFRLILSIWIYIIDNEYDIYTIQSDIEQINKDETFIKDVLFNIPLLYIIKPALKSTMKRYLSNKLYIYFEDHVKDKEADNTKKRIYKTQLKYEPKSTFKKKKNNKKFDYSLMKENKININSHGINRRLNINLPMMTIYNDSDKKQNRDKSLCNRFIEKCQPTYINNNTNKPTESKVLYIRKQIKSHFYGNKYINKSKSLPKKSKKDINLDSNLLNTSNINCDDFSSKDSADSLSTTNEDDSCVLAYKTKKRIDDCLCNNINKNEPTVSVARKNLFSLLNQRK